MEQQETTIDDNKMEIDSNFTSPINDIVLIVGDAKYPANRSVLSASSEIFEYMLYSPLWIESKTTEIKLVESPKATAAFPEFLRYISTKNVDLNVENVLPILSLADKYTIKNLSEVSKDFMHKNIAAAANDGNFISWLQYTHLIDDHLQITNDLMNFLRLNFKMVANNKSIVELDPNNLCIILQQNDLVVESEMVVFDIVELYLSLKQVEIEMNDSLSAEQIENQMKAFFDGLFCHVRFPMMTPEEIAAIPSKMFAKFNEEFFNNRISLALSYHENHQVKSCDEFLQYTPRLYASDAFCTKIKVEDIQNVEEFAGFKGNLCSLQCFPISNSLNENKVEWTLEFFPKGIYFQLGRLVNVFIVNNNLNNNPIPNSELKTVRVRSTCRIYDEIRFKIAAIVWGYESKVPHMRTFKTHTGYFSPETRVINLDNLIPIEEIQNSESCYLMGENRDSMEVSVIILPFNRKESKESPPLEFC